MTFKIVYGVAFSLVCAIFFALIFLTMDLVLFALDSLSNSIRFVFPSRFYLSYSEFFRFFHIWEDSTPLNVLWIDIVQHV